MSSENFVFSKFTLLDKHTAEATNYYCLSRNLEDAKEYMTEMTKDSLSGFSIESVEEVDKQALADVDFNGFPSLQTAKDVISKQISKAIIIAYKISG